jgi:hypothetical protein
MMRRRCRPNHAAMLIAFIVAGCATSASVATGETFDVRLQIDNDLRAMTSVTAYLRSEAGVRRSLGPIESNDDATFGRALRPGVYQLVAARIGAYDIVSEPFRIDSDGMVVSWSLARNQLIFARH